MFASIYSSTITPTQFFIMAAAALVTLHGGTLDYSEDAVPGYKSFVMTLK